jgi:poly(A) polymerase/tRNA nucleotidyltransferase (CCA-adding enzyme)
MFTDMPKEVLNCAQMLEAAGFEAHLVGGCVRDLVINRAPKDWDITTNATPEQIQAIFPDSFYENTFGTVGVKTRSEDPKLAVIEVTPYRIEGKYSDKRRPDEVTFSTKLEDDLHRRDFTINAIAYRPHTDTLVDLFDGKKDIAEKRLKAVGDANKRFEEDALRILRALRFSAELDFTIDLETMTAIMSHAHGLAEISRERIRDEFLRILNSAQPMPALFVAQRLGVLKYIIPELEEGIGCTQNQAHSFDVFEHLLRSLQCAADNNWSIDIRIAALLHDIGKPATRRFDDAKKDYTFYGHEVVGARMAKRICEDLRLPADLSKRVVDLIRWHMFFSDPDQITLSAVRRMIVNVGGPQQMWDLLNVRVCDRIGTGRPKAHPFRLRKYISMVEEALRDPISVTQLKIDGRGVIDILAERPGPKVGWILHALLEEVLDDPSKNTEEYLQKQTRALAQLSEAELKKLGESGKDKKEEADAAEVQKLRAKHHVS